MGKLRVLSGRAVCAILSANGFSPVRQSGSHVILQKQTENEATITVPVPDHATLAIGTLQAIIRQSGLSRALFETV